MYQTGTKSKGQALIIVMIAIALLLAAGAILIKYTFNEYNSSVMFADRYKAFYLAEAGIEDAKFYLSGNMNWFTDPSHAGAEDTKWIMNEAKGHERLLGAGHYKIVRESGKNIAYGVGYYKNSRVVLKVNLQFSPFKVSELKEI